ncbi:MAG: hypothetical protein MMC33_001153 [Icmadophila ericetorum]|nr:hypothetical protein [Icmadophila ericetorum]
MAEEVGVEPQGSTKCEANIGSAILYQNEQNTLTLIDLPTSIALAQGLQGDPPPIDILLSSIPLQAPYPSIEPKSESAIANVLKRQGSNHLEDYQEFISNGLQEVRDKHSGDWCKPRQVLSHDQTQWKKDKGAVEHVSKDSKDDRDRFPYSNSKCLFLKLDQAPGIVRYRSASQLTLRPVHNVRTTRCLLGALAECSSDVLEVYRIPPNSTFLSCNINEQSADEFSEAVVKFYPTPSASAAPGQFDFILLDPPWSNKSVKRSKMYKTMKTTFGSKVDLDPISVLRRMLGNHIAPQGLVACWITNNFSVREAALKAFEDWEVDLIEEWVWLKTTVTGVPVYDLAGLWRKPYEVLLVGRKTSLFVSERTVDTSREVKRRLIVGVPDLHSRKPSLKELIEPMMLDSQNYRALEVFARNLTAGWWSWGNEVLEINKNEYWKSVWV